MELKIPYVKQFYKFQLRINRLSERDRILLVFISILVLLSFWYFVIFHFQMQDLNQKRRTVQDIQTKMDDVNQKKMVIKNLVNNADAASLLVHHSDLIKQITKLNQRINNYNKHYISSRDLAKLMHDMLKQTNGLVLDSFSTVVTPLASIAPPIKGVPQPPPDQPTLKSNLSLEPIHYRLIIRGNYFTIMNYLKRLEELPWHLYWDKLDYTVIKYPEGLATMEFYTLKPAGTQPVSIKKQGKP